MIRNPWMKIKEIDGFARRFKFMGVVIIKGKELNQLLRKTENPLHNDWEPERIKSNSYDYELVKKLLSNIKTVIKSKLENLHTVDLDSYLDIFGADEYLPLHDPDSKRKVQRKVEDKVKKTSIRKLNPSLKTKDIHKIAEGNVEMEINGDEEGNVKEKPNPHRLKSKTKREIFEENLKKNFSKIQVKKEDIRIIAINRHDGQYRILIRRELPAKYHVKLFILDEQGEMIKNALDLKEVLYKSDKLNFIDNYIKNINMQAGINYIDIKINVQGYVSIGVELYEVSR